MVSIFNPQAFNANINELGEVVRIPPGDHTVTLTNFNWGPTTPSQNSESKYMEFVFTHPDYPRNPIAERIYYQGKTGNLIVGKNGSKFWEDNFYAMLFKLGVTKDEIKNQEFIVPYEGTQGHIGDLIAARTQINVKVSHKTNKETGRTQQEFTFHRKPELVTGNDHDISIPRPNIPPPPPPATRYVPKHLRPESKSNIATAPRNDHTDMYIKSAELAKRASQGGKKPYKPNKLPTIAAPPTENKSILDNSDLNAQPAKKLKSSSSSSRKRSVSQSSATSDSEMGSSNESVSTSNNTSNTNTSSPPSTAATGKDSQLAKLEKAEKDAQRAAEKVKEIAEKAAKKAKELEEREEKKKKEAADKADKEAKKEEERKKREADKALAEEKKKEERAKREADKLTAKQAKEAAIAAKKRQQELEKANKAKGKSSKGKENQDPNSAVDMSISHVTDEHSNQLSLFDNQAEEASDGHDSDDNMSDDGSEGSDGTDPDVVLVE